MGNEGPIAKRQRAPRFIQRARALGKRRGEACADVQYLPRQSTRMLKVACPDCGCVCRMARTWLDCAGAPTCACGAGMVEA
jgi:hypothetical protein